MKQSKKLNTKGSVPCIIVYMMMLWKPIGILPICMMICTLHTEMTPAVQDLSMVS